MAGKDLIDEAMAADDTDYGDKTPDTSDVNDNTQQPQTQDGPDDTNDAIDPSRPQEPRPSQQLDRPQPQQTKPNGQQQLSQQPQLKRVGAQFADGKGNIVDKDGKIVARAGSEARLWQEASRATAQVANLTRINEQMQQRMQANEAIMQRAREVAELPQKLGVSKEDFNEGITLMSKWRSDPLGVAKEIVARAMSFGYNATDILGKNAGDSLEMSALRRLVDEATAPMKQQRERETQQQQEQTRGQQEYNAFVTRYPLAEVHADAIARLMSNGSPAVDAYFAVKEFALENGLDFNSPLGPQVAAMRNGGQRHTPPQDQRRSAAPMPNGGRTNNSQLTDQPAMADARDDWGTILSDVMRHTN